MRLIGKELIQLDEFRLDLSNRRLERNGKAVHLPPKAFETLLALIQAHPGAITRAELRNALWPDTAVEDSNLTQNIYVVRRALGCSAEGADYVETVAKHGYRLTGHPRIVVEPAAVPASRSSVEVLAVPREVSAAGVLETASNNGHSPTVAPRQSPRWTVLAVALAVLVLCSLALSNIWRRQSNRFQALSLVNQGFRQVRENQVAGLGPSNTLFRQALELDPSLAPAYAGLAEVMARSVEPSPGQAWTMAERAVRLDPRCAECQAIAGWILMGREWRFAEAGRYLDTATALDPRNTRILMWHAQMLACSGNLTRALEEINRARAFDFKGPHLATMRAGILYLSERYEESITAARESLGLDPDYVSAHDWIYRSCIRLQRVEEALSAKAALNATFLGLSADGRFEMESRWGDAYQEGGLPKLVEVLLASNAAKPGLDHQRYERATWKMWVNDRAGALDELEHVSDFRPFNAIYLGVDPMFASLRGEKRFQDLLSRMGLDAILVSR